MILAFGYVIIKLGALYFFIVLGDSTDKDLVSPSIYAAYKGNDVVITCMSHTKAKWTKEGKKLSSLRNSTLIIYDVKNKDSGIYICQGSHENGTKFQGHSELLVGSRLICYYKVEQGKSFTLDCDVSATYGETIRLICLY